MLHSRLLRDTKPFRFCFWALHAYLFTPNTAHLSRAHLVLVLLFFLVILVIRDAENRRKEIEEMHT